MTNYVKDNTSLFFPKTNFRPLAVGVSSSQAVQAIDWNTAMQALEDIKGVLRGGDWYGLNPLASDPLPSGVNQYLWMNTSNVLFLHHGGNPGTNVSLGSGATTPAVEHLTASGVISPTIDRTFVHASSPGSVAFTLANGSVDGFIKTICYINNDGGMTLTVASIADLVTTFTATGPGGLQLVWDATAVKWHLVGAPQGFTIS